MLTDIGPHGVFANDYANNKLKCNQMGLVSSAEKIQSLVDFAFMQTRKRGIVADF